MERVRRGTKAEKEPKMGCEICEIARFRGRESRRTKSQKHKRRATGHSECENRRPGRRQGKATWSLESDLVVCPVPRVCRTSNLEVAVAGCPSLVPFRRVALPRLVLCCYLGRVREQPSLLRCARTVLLRKRKGSMLFAACRFDPSLKGGVAAEPSECESHDDASMLKRMSKCGRQRALPEEAR
jgi:hypothetical protein